tara:strand:- start:235 stop:492 length:258 start_codon:yes stop_codon:yes gene_type:complete
MMKIEVFGIKGTPIWFFTAYTFTIDIALFSELEKDRIYHSSELIYEDKLAIEKKLIIAYKDIHKETVSDNNKLAYFVDQFDFYVL